MTSRFLAADILLIIIYQSVPLLYLALLLKHRNALRRTDLNDSRETDPSIQYIAFLWQVPY